MTKLGDKSKKRSKTNSMSNAMLADIKKRKAIAKEAKSSQNDEVPFTTINHDVRRRFGLSLNEYSIADSIYHLSHANEHHLCYSSKEYLGEFIGVSKQTVHTIINTLVKLKLVERYGNYLTTTLKWNQAYTKKKKGKKSVRN